MIDEARDFIDSDPLTLAASIAFYTALSFAPVIVLGLWAVAQLSPGAEDRLIDQLGAVLGSQVRAIAQTVVEHAGATAFKADFAGLVGAGALLVSASTAFAQFQASINRIWGVEAPPVNALMQWLRRRLLSFGMIAVVGFLLMVALVVSSLLALVLTREGVGWVVFNEAATLLLFGVAFAALFRHVPDIRIPWRGALIGGLLTAVLFETGKWVLGRYLATAASADAYGGASALVLLLLWAYYSSLIVLVGAGITRAITRAIDPFEWPTRQAAVRNERDVDSFGPAEPGTRA
ncbi:MAG: YihY/virulence factor BrkB family protein [Xanthomonadales bacterium]|nr:YihY/virulence factor BrkB family protein [Xanthomonadales bacterium]